MSGNRRRYDRRAASRRWAKKPRAPRDPNSTSHDRQVEANERLRVDGRPQLRERYPGRQMRCCRREEVAPVKGTRHDLERVGRIRELPCLDYAGPFRRGDEQAVVGADEQAPVRVAQD